MSIFQQASQVVGFHLAFSKVFSVVIPLHSLSFTLPFHLWFYLVLCALLFPLSLLTTCILSLSIEIYTTVLLVSYLLWVFQFEDSYTMVNASIHTWERQCSICLSGSSLPHSRWSFEALSIAQKFYHHPLDVVNRKGVNIDKQISLWSDTQFFKTKLRTDMAGSYSQSISRLLRNLDTDFPSDSTSLYFFQTFIQHLLYLNFFFILVILTRIKWNLKRLFNLYFPDI